MRGKGIMAAGLSMVSMVLALLWMVTMVISVDGDSGSGSQILICLLLTLGALRTLLGRVEEEENTVWGGIDRMTGLVAFGFLPALMAFLAVRAWFVQSEMGFGATALLHPTNTGWFRPGTLHGSWAVYVLLTLPVIYLMQVSLRTARAAVHFRGPGMQAIWGMVLIVLAYWWFETGQQHQLMYSSVGAAELAEMSVLQNMFWPQLQGLEFLAYPLPAGLVIVLVALMVSRDRFPEASPADTGWKDRLPHFVFLIISLILLLIWQWNAALALLGLGVLLQLTQLIIRRK